MTKIGELFNGPTPSASIGGAIGTIFGTLILVLVENRTGIFRIIKGTSNYSASPTWLLLATSITVCLFLSLLSFVSIYFSTKKYFREDFAFAAISATYWLGLGLFLSLTGRLMFWHPFIAIFYLLAGKSIPLSEPAFSEYVIVILLTIIFYNFAKNRYKNWDGMKSENQYVREQGNDDRGMFIDYLETINVTSQ